jgi:hypothetical protein
MRHTFKMRGGVPLNYPSHIMELLAAPYAGASIAEAYAAAGRADAAFQEAIERAGYSSRWDIPHRKVVLLDEYAAKVAADHQMHLAFAANRGV